MLQPLARVVTTGT